MVMCQNFYVEIAEPGSMIFGYMFMCLAESCFCVPELISSSFALIRKDSRYTERDAAVVVRQMLKVAAECHLHGLVHRDMKPEV